MGALSWAQSWFVSGRSKDDSGTVPSAKAVQDKSRFHYSPDLIASLKGDHAELLRLYGEIEKMAIAGRFATIPGALAAFKSKFDVHILNENLHFYCYVEQRLGRRPDDLQLMRDFRTDMNTIARDVVNFVKAYRTYGVRPSTGDEFLAELRAVGALLVQRVEREEKDLYALYQP
jgi:hypothetical protein